MSEPIRVFVSYTHDSPEHSARVLALSNALRGIGFECDIDQYHANQRWPQWMEERLEWADYVLIVCTQIYLRRWKAKEAPGIGLGAQWESLLTHVHLYQSPLRNEKFVPIVFYESDIPHIPIPLADVTHVVVGRNLDHMDQLRSRLLNIAPAVMPPVLTSLSPIAVATGFFSQATRQRVECEFSPESIGLHSEAEELVSNLLPVQFPDTIYTAKIKLKRGVDFEQILRMAWNRSKCDGAPPVDYLKDYNTLYTFTDLKEGVWGQLVKDGVLNTQPPLPASKWAQSAMLAERNLFIKLLNQCLRSLCEKNGTNYDIRFSKNMRCRFFAPRVKKGVEELDREGKLKAFALKAEATRTVFRAIPDKKSDDPKAIQHWQHEAFRSRFVRFGKSWYLVLTPFWAFTSDGTSSPSKWQKKSSSNMRKPERNRAVLGHVSFWQAVLSKEPDMFTAANAFRIGKSAPIAVSPSIRDSEWMTVAKPDERKELETDIGLLL